MKDPTTGLPLLLGTGAKIIGASNRLAGVGHSCPCRSRRGKLSSLIGARTGQSLPGFGPSRSEEHTSELQSLMRISYAVFCLKKKHNKQLPSRQEDTVAEK